MKKILSFGFFILFFSGLFGQIQTYYDGIDVSKTGDELFQELSDLLKTTHISIPYTSGSTDTWDVLTMAEEDPENTLNVLLIYGFDDSDGNVETDRSRLKTETDNGGGESGKWNREHVYAKSLASPNLSTEDPGPGTDVHNLRPSDSKRNENRSNRKFAEGSGSSGTVSLNGGWYPGDEWKGDVARTIMYMYLRYDGDGSKISETQCLPINIGIGTPLAMDSNMIDLFLRWNFEDPVSAFEDQHNTIAEANQGNRNPFIDNPYLATLIWGGINAEDRWGLNNSSDVEVPSIPTNIVAQNLTDDAVEISWNASTDNVGVIDYLIYSNNIYVQNSLTTSTTINGLTQNTAYDITIKARDAEANISLSSAALSVITLEGPIILLSENFENCADINFTIYSEASNKDWVCETQFGHNNSGSLGINGYQQNEYSKDWLIASDPIDFDKSESEKLSFYSDAAYGNTVLELVYSTDYDGSSNPGNFTWTPVPNVSIPAHSNGGGTEESFSFDNIDISSINGLVYIAFKYYAGVSPTRWTVDNFEITAESLILAAEDFQKDALVIKAYPNPNSGSFMISTPSINNEAIVELYNVQSQLISSSAYQLRNGNIEMNMNAVPAGIYFLKVHLNNNFSTLKIVKQ